MSRTAEEWSRLAVSLPGWRWMPGMLSRCSTDTRRAAYRWLAGPSDDRHYGHVLIVEDKHGHACRTLATLQPGLDDLPDPDDPATAGCLLALAGAPHRFFPTVEAWLAGAPVEGITSLGRAVIADVRDRWGRWPNVAESGRKGAE